jgi:hypothetical protein
MQADRKSGCLRLLTALAPTPVKEFGTVCRTSLIALALTTGAASSSAAQATAQAVGSRVGVTFQQ